MFEAKRKAEKSTWKIHRKKPHIKEKNKDCCCRKQQQQSGEEHTVDWFLFKFRN